MQKELVRAMLKMQANSPLMGRKRWLNVFMETERERKDEKVGKLGCLAVGIAFLECVCSQREATSVSPAISISEETNCRCAVGGARDIMAM